MPRHFQHINFFLHYSCTINLNVLFKISYFQTRFDDLWRRYQTYSGGEELFGLPKTEYEDLARIKKELSLLQKLYGLYNAVIDGINGYYDILWHEVDIEKINNELVDFQSRHVLALVILGMFSAIVNNQIKQLQIIIMCY